MTDLQEMRARLREERALPAVAGGGFKIPFGLIAILAVVLGFIVVLFTPKIYPVQRTAALPTFSDVKDRLESPTRSAMMSQVAVPTESAARYIGRGADEAGKIADAVCFQKAHALVPHWSKTPRLTTKELADFADVESMKHFSTLLQCLVTEAPARYCSRGQRTMIKAEIVTYFRGIDHANTAVKRLVNELTPRLRQTQSEELNDPDSSYQKLASLKFAPDEKVMTGIEGLIRNGYLGVAERDEIGRSAAAPIRDRFARVVGGKSPCPAPPWWAVWR
jgi:hypothetical protein